MNRLDKILEEALDAARGGTYEGPMLVQEMRHRHHRAVCRTAGRYVLASVVVICGLLAWVYTNDGRGYSADESRCGGTP